jgi:hypothetical protein
MIYFNTDIIHNAMFSVIMNPESLSTSDLLLIFTGVAATVFVATITVGSIFGFKTDFIILAPVIAGILGIVTVFTQLAGILRSDFGYFFGCHNLATNALQQACMFNPAINIIIALLVGIPAFLFIWTVIDWWRGKDN